MFRGNTDSVLMCPFCERPLEDPQEIMTRFGSTVNGGKCECGTVYVYDRSGHNMGDAYVDVLGLACGGDMDMAWGLIPDEDYELRELTYNSRKNKFGRDAFSRGKPSPVYLFVKLKSK
jgi:hypothetical protein